MVKVVDIDCAKNSIPSPPSTELYICYMCIYSGVLFAFSKHTIGATFLPFKLVVFSVSGPCGAKADQLSCDVGETPLQPSGALPPKITSKTD